VLKASATETHAAMLMSKSPMATKMKGVIVMAQENRGVAKFISVASSTVFLAVFWMLVSSRSVKSAFSRSEIFVEMPRAKLVVNMVIVMTVKPASAANAEPTIMPSRIKVESNIVLIKNLRIIGPTLSRSSVSRKPFMALHPSLVESTLMWLLALSFIFVSLCFCSLTKNELRNAAAKTINLLMCIDYPVRIQ